MKFLNKSIGNIHVSLIIKAIGMNLKKWKTVVGNVFLFYHKYIFMCY
jgi:hypothetical protein